MTIHDEILSGKLAAVKQYLASGGDIEARDALQRTPLLMAMERGQVSIARLLLDSGADPAAIDYRKFTTLHRSAGMGSSELVALLLAAGLDPNARNAFQATPLHEIARGGGRAPAKHRIAVVEALLAAGAVLEALDSSGRTPLWFAAATGTTQPSAAASKARLAVLKLLLDRGADPTRKADGEQGTPLDAAHGRHQRKQYRIAWPEAIRLLEKAAPSP